MNYLKLTIACTTHHLADALYCNIPKEIGSKPQTKCWIARSVRDIMPQAEVFLNGIFPSATSKRAIAMPKFVLERMRFFDEATVKERMSLKPFEFTAVLDDTIINEILKANNWGMDDLMKSIRKSENITLHDNLKLIEA